MSTLYSVIRYVPSAISEESVNIGLLVVDQSSVKVRGLADWSRVKSFAGREWKSVKRLVEDLRESPQSLLNVQTSDNLIDLNLKLREWQRSLRFSPVRGSLETADSLLQTLPGLFLHEASEGKLDGNGRRKVIVDNAFAAVTLAFATRFERKPSGLLQRDLRTSGKRTQHKVDIGIANGELYAGAFAITFASTQENRQWRDTDAIAFALEDIEGRNDVGHKLAVIMDAPQENYPSQRAKTLFLGLGAELVSSENIQAWATRAVTRVPDRVFDGY